ncbi:MULTISPECIES: formate dehydrogenase subunit gamma [Achromobacter]|uniref:Formate dehydrogenase subunit gamma n=2 Tax=Achromobacter TaxID=222 RepID=A0A0X8P330_ALCXX|nr:MULTISPECIES: formate dehydrogenase subunit gamma [Achromobacter]AMG39029.1 formate dehydrogenase subunit gamma [Achromobacter xylosoxidans]EGP47516.1 formate dehydrogenase subunit gamma [Achromobacter insuavis AXX-A]
MRQREAKSDLASTGGARGGPLALDAAQASASPAVAATARILARLKDQPGPLLPVLHAVQHELGCIPAEAVQTIAEALNLSRAEVHGVITFYPHFRGEPAGRHTLEVCRAESCQAMGGEQLAEHARQALGCDFHASTRDGDFTLEPVYCLGLCAQSPAVMLDGQPHARVTPAKLDRLLHRVREAGQ